MNYLELKTNPVACSLEDIPVLDYDRFREQTVKLLSDKSCHAVNYFVQRFTDRLMFFMIVADDRNNCIYVYSHEQNADVNNLESLTRFCFQLHVFEREIAECSGIAFTDNPWPKPLRFPFDRFNMESVIENYPFYTIESEELHEVGVGPVHAGIIEPGHFRFLCYGEKVHHLEIQLGYQHRGIESLISGTDNVLKQVVLSESVAGDTAVGHGLAYTQLSEALTATEVPESIKCERIIGLELERMAVNAGDTAALCGDVAYQFGQAVNEALRTILINTTQDWCGNRFGKGLIRPGGTNFPVSGNVKPAIIRKTENVFKRFHQAGKMIYENSGILGRFENTGVVDSRQAWLSGSVGMAARASGVMRDIRASHPFQAFTHYQYHPVVLETGDVLARGMLRQLEFEKSYNIIRKILEDHLINEYEVHPVPSYNNHFAPNMLCLSLVEGWRGEICHTAITDKNGRIIKYKIKEPSLHNWLMLALAVRGEEISDFPLCNKSFNLSYCGHDL